MLSAKAVLRGCFMAVAGALAAAIAHVVVNVAGDYLLVRDSYDGIEHHSRALLLAGIGLLAILATIRTVFDALDRRGGTAASLLGLLRSALARPLAFAAGSTCLAIVFLAAMEAFDCALVSQVDDVNDLFGGSLLLGLTTVVVTGMLCGWLVRRVLNWIAAYEIPIAAFILSAFSSNAGRLAEIGAPSHARAVPTVNHGLLLSRRRHKRGPPRTLGFSPS